MTPEQRQRVEMADWQKARFGDSDEARAALAYWRERGWHVDDRQKCPDERVYDFMSGWRAAHALTAAALDAAEQERDRQIVLTNQNAAAAVIERQRAEQAEAKLAALTAPPAPREAVRVLEMIAVERQRQVSAEGWTPEHDDLHVNGELSEAAAGYAVAWSKDALQPVRWPWEASWWKPSDDRIKNLVKAGALIVAEIERLQRLAALRAEAQP